MCDRAELQKIIDLDTERFRELGEEIQELKKRIEELEKNFLWLNARRNTPGIGDYVQFVLKELNISEGDTDG